MMDDKIKNGYNSLIQTFKSQKASIEQTIEQEVAKEMQNRNSNIIAPYESKVVAKTNEAIGKVNEQKAKEIADVEKKYLDICNNLRDEANKNIDNKKSEEEASVRLGVNAQYQQQISELTEQIDFLTKHIEQ